ncbi:radical SAM protein [Candidatus Omnitrophota bacterium]
MDNFKLSKFMYETLAAGGTNQLPISSVCNAKCIFCSNKMNPFHIYRVGFRSLADIKKGINLLDEASEIRLGDSLPGRIAEGEALLHPNIYQILKLIRHRRPQNIIQIPTNGTVLTKDVIKKLIPYQPMKFTISYHSDNQKFWRKAFGLGKNEFHIARDSFVHLKRNNFLIEVVVVPLPQLTGYNDIEHTLTVLSVLQKKL